MLWPAWVQGAFFLWLVVPVYIVLKYRYAVNRYILLFDYKYIVILDTLKDIKYNTHRKQVMMWPDQSQ